MTRSRDDVLKLINAMFDAADWQLVTATLDQYGVETNEQERARVQFAILMLSEGDLTKLDEFVAVAKNDYRDVLYWYEYPTEARLDTPAKRAAVRDLFVTLGLTPPSGLDD